MALRAIVIMGVAFLNVGSSGASSFKEICHSTCTCPAGSDASPEKRGSSGATYFNQTKANTAVKICEKDKLLNYMCLIFICKLSGTVTATSRQSPTNVSLSLTFLGNTVPVTHSASAWGQGGRKLNANVTYTVLCTTNNGKYSYGGSEYTPKDIYQQYQFSYSNDAYSDGINQVNYSWTALTCDFSILGMEI